VDALAAVDGALTRADNPSAFTLEGTNTWLVGRDPCWVVDPGPALPAHQRQVAAGIADRGGLGGVVVTHDHPDHVEGVRALLEAAGMPDARVGAARFRDAATPVALRDGDELGPFRVVATPGHAPDHLAFVAGRACFTGDAVLGHGSVFVAPDPGALRGYLAALEGLEALELDVLCPGHGPLVLDPRSRLREYREHRLDRERRLVAALDAGLRTVDELLDRAWADAPAALRPAAALTLAAHLDKLGEEGRLPAGVERPVVPPLTGVAP
jgi:glyoxylase-like metal-dependent hydrolase (beta-lactamase superfamily II)